MRDLTILVNGGVISRFSYPQNSVSAKINPREIFLIYSIMMQSLWLVSVKDLTDRLRVWKVLQITACNLIAKLVPFYCCMNTRIRRKCIFVHIIEKFTNVSLLKSLYSLRVPDAIKN